MKIRGYSVDEIGNGLGLYRTVEKTKGRNTYGK